MNRHFVIVSCVLLATAATVTAQSTPPTATQPARRVHRPYDEEAQRRRGQAQTRRWEGYFVDMYKLNDQQKQQLQTTLAEMVEADVKYWKDVDAVRNQASDEYQDYARKLDYSRRLKLARTKNEEANIQKYEEFLKDERQAAGADIADDALVDIMTKKQQDARKRFDAIRNDAPLTMDRIAEAVEKTLPPDQAKAGHEEFLKRKPYGGRPPSATQPAVGTRPATPGARVQPLPDDPRLRRPSAYRTVTVVAPSLDRWAAIVEALIVQLKLDPDQAQKARRIHDQVKGWADQYVQSHAKDFQDASAIADADERGKRLDELNRPLDVRYDELISRITHLARADQYPAGGPSAPSFAPSLDRWAAAVERIIKERRYDEQQTTSAMGVLTDIRSRAQQQYDAHKDDFARAEKIADPAARGQELAKLNEPLDKLFDEMLQRVKGMSRADQIPATQPAAPTTATQPSRRIELAPGR